ncbi:hypothetical protein GCM10022279_29890 [Comamonas faecalis]|uniref:Uncharacterized protein n=1 Tax=Comamonas faecalis TaxID=1387849 RepID=A0ABP7RYF4_9BURK
MSDETTFTVGDLRRELSIYDDDTKLSFDGGLTFGRVKNWGDDEIILLFAEPQAYLEEKFKEKNPNVKVAFMRIDNVEWDESGVIGGPIDVSIK